jgi:hypothetical protein
VDACNPLLQARPTWAQGNTKAAGFPFACLLPPFVLRLAPTHLGWDTRRQFTRRSRDPPGSKRRHPSSLPLGPFARHSPPARFPPPPRPASAAQPRGSPAPQTLGHALPSRRAPSPARGPAWLACPRPARPWLSHAPRPSARALARVPSSLHARSRALAQLPPPLAVGAYLPSWVRDVLFIFPNCPRPRPPTQAPGRVYLLLLPQTVGPAPFVPPCWPSCVVVRRQLAAARSTFLLPLPHPAGVVPLLACPFPARAHPCAVA